MYMILRDVFLEAVVGIIVPQSVSRLLEMEVTPPLAIVILAFVSVVLNSYGMCKLKV